MNWVGGSRIILNTKNGEENSVLTKILVSDENISVMTRVLLKQEKRKQKEYFEKKRFKSKMKLLGVLSPVKNSTVSLDLLNLYVVNQISCQKKTPETMRKPIHVNMNRDIKMPLKKHDLELPMSPPYVPSKLCIDDLESSMHHQRLGSKEELGPVQLSQGMDSYRIFEPQFNRVENCSFTPSSFSAELSSNRNVTEQNFIPRIAPSPQKVAYEKKQNEQLSNVNYSNYLFSKLNEHQDALSPSYKTAQIGTLFERLSSPGNRNFLAGSPAIVMGEDCGSMGERRHSDFITEKQSVQHIWGENKEEVSNFLEDVDQPTPSLLPENFDSFINENAINLLSIDQQRITKPFENCGYDSMGVTNSDKNHSSDRCIFRNPGLNFSSSNFNKTSYSEKCQPKNYQREYNNEGNNPSTSFEKNCYPASAEKKGKFEKDYQKKKPQIEIQKYPVNNMSIPLEELNSKKSWDFGLSENLIEEGGTCSIKGAPKSTKKIFNNNDSSQSSLSSSYSPRATDSCFSSSSEMPSDDEDQTLQKIEDASRRSIKTEETTNNFYLERMAEFPHDRIVKNNEKIHKQTESFHQVSVKNNTDQSAQSQHNSIHVLQNQTSNNRTVQFVRCDAWVQTESEPVMKERLDAAIQCDIISQCKCRSNESSLCNVERCSENIKADTTGGQEVLKNS